VGDYTDMQIFDAADVWQYKVVASTVCSAVLVSVVCLKLLQLILLCDAIL